MHKFHSNKYDILDNYVTFYLWTAKHCTYFGTFALIQFEVSLYNIYNHEICLLYTSDAADEL